MDLLLWRHAEAEDGFPDSKRKLTARGEKQAAQIAEWLKKHAPKNLENRGPDMPAQQSPATMPPLTEEETRMDLLLWRHAEAEDGFPDLKRKLTTRGENQAAQMAEWLKKNAP